MEIFEATLALLSMALVLSVLAGRLNAASYTDKDDGPAAAPQ